mmetsp:Transcript_13702/g.6790  ORF Transcript_13702/g.6790 Transcript_13702/m.6790 type:complete len:118 (-) Transcript_13702:1320-1673(-)
MIMISRMDGCLVAYTIDEWTKIEEKIMSMAKRSADMRRFRRVFIGGASKCLLDKQNRVLIPPPLREYSKLEKEIELVGVIDHFEIWSRKNWENENLIIDKDMEDKEFFSNEISELGF